MFAREARVSVMIVKVNGITESYLVEQKNDLYASMNEMQLKMIGYAHATLKICMWQKGFTEPGEYS